MPLTYFWQSIWAIIQTFLAFQKFLSLFPSNAEDRFSPDLHCIHVWQARESQQNRSICRRFMYFFTEWRHTCVRVQGSIPLDENKRTIFVLLKAFISFCSKQEREKFKICFRKIASLAFPVIPWVADEDKLPAGMERVKLWPEWQSWTWHTMNKARSKENQGL